MPQRHAPPHQRGCVPYHGSETSLTVHNDLPDHLEVGHAETLGKQPDSQMVTVTAAVTVGVCYGVTQVLDVAEVTCVVEGQPADIIICEGHPWAFKADWEQGASCRLEHPDRQGASTRNQTINLALVSVQERMFDKADGKFFTHRTLLHDGERIAMALSAVLHWTMTTAVSPVGCHASRVSLDNTVTAET